MTKHTILFLAADPNGTDRRAIDREANAICKELRASGYRDRFEFVTRWAAEPLDLLRELRRLRPAVVHFSGRGGREGLLFQAPTGEARVVTPEALEMTFGAEGLGVKLVVLSACHSDGTAEALLAHVDCVVGMTGALHDDEARAFAIGFYGALGDRESVATAYEHGRAAIHLEGLPAAERPRLRVRAGVDAARLVLAVDKPAVHMALPCPYPGMQPYSADDADHFHGRGAEIAELIGRLRAGEREIYIIGPSGSGKSSLVAAGVLPRLARPTAGVGPFLVRSMRPGEDPAMRLGKLLEVPDGERAAPADAIAALLTGRSASSSVLILIDQLEELFTLADAGERKRFLCALAALREAPRCAIVFTLRADFYGAFMESPLGTGRRGRISHIEVYPLRGKAMVEAIVRPARDLGVHVEPELMVRLLADAGSEPGILPLLQESLVQLWDRRQGQTLTLADYQALGDGDRSGLAVALARRADALLRDLTAAQEAIARRILLRLISFGEGRSDTRRQQARSKLRAGDDAPVDFDFVLRRLIDARLLTAADDDHGGDARIDLAHEVVIAAWPKLAGWIQTHRAEEQRRRQLEAAAARWAECGRLRYLLDPIELAEAEAWQRTDSARELGQSADLRELIAESKRAHERQRRRRRGFVLGTFTALAVFAVVVAILAIAARHEANEAEASRARAEADRRRAEASDGESRRLLARSYLETGWQHLLGGHPQEAMPYLLAAREHGEENAPLRMLIGAATRFLPLLPILEHRAAVSSAAFSPDGTRIVTASSDHTARLWDAATGRTLGAPLQHQDGVNGAAFSPDGARVVTASSDHTARVWDAATGEALTAALRHRGAVWRAVFAPDGHRVVTASDDHTARIWDAATGAAIGAPFEHRGVVWSAAFSPDGTRVLTASWDWTARIWDAATGEPVGAPLQHADRVWSAAFSPDGARVATTSRDGTARVWDAATGKPLAATLQHQNVARSAAFSPDGRRVVTASSDHTARIWDAATGAPIGAPLKHPGAVWNAAFSPDGTRVLTASLDKTARVWDAATGAPVGTPLEHQGGVNGAAFSPDGTRVVTASLDHSARVWDAATGRPLVVSLRHDEGVEDAAFSPDGTRVVTASLDHTARIWDAATGHPLTAPLQHRGSVLRAAFSPDGTRVVTASADHTARVWDTATGHLGAALEHQGNVTGIVFSPDGARVMTASADHTARVWDAATGRPLAPALPHGGPVWSAAFSPDGTRVATASADGTARVWDPATGRPLGAPLEHRGWVRSAAFSPDGTRVATASIDGTARIWDAATSRPLVAPLEHRGGVWSATFGPDGARIVTTSFDNTARIWDLTGDRPVATVLEHQGAVNGAAFSPDGTRVVTASDDHTTRIWDVATGKPLAPPLQHRGAVYGAAFSPDGTRIVTASDDRTARIWWIPLDETPRSGWPALAARSPFVTGGAVPVRHAPGSAPSIVPIADMGPAPAPGTAPQLPDLRAEGAPFAPWQIWSGHYFCSQGRTSLVLQITAVRNNTVGAVFAFAHADSGASGGHRASGRYDLERRRLELSPVEWIRQPPGYMMVALTGTVSANGVRFVGSFPSSGCSTFEVRLR